jgi:hypothetical protein
MCALLPFKGWRASAAGCFSAACRGVPFAYHWLSATEHTTASSNNTFSLFPAPFLLCVLLTISQVGHAVCGTLTPGHDPVQKVTLIPRGQARGLTWFIPGAFCCSFRKGFEVLRLPGFQGFGAITCAN